MKHLAIFDKQGAEAIFSGQRKIEGRFSRIKLPPFGQIAKDDWVLVKKRGEKIVGHFTVSRVIFFDHPSKEDLEWMRKKYGKEMAMETNFWRKREKINFATLIFIDSVGKFLVAPTFPKKDLRSWVVLE